MAKKKPRVKVTTADAMRIAGLLQLDAIADQTLKCSLPPTGAPRVFGVPVSSQTVEVHEVIMTYLCGGINGMSDADCRDWRESAKSTLKTGTLDPMRRDYRGREAECVNEIVHGDLNDISVSQFVLVNAIRPSWGTAMEIVYAYQAGIPVVAWTGDARVSPWLRYHSVALHPSLGAAVNDINKRAGFCA